MVNKNVCVITPDSEQSIQCRLQQNINSKNKGGGLMNYREESCVGLIERSKLASELKSTFFLV